jgi:predicted RND superfamily exporter protein
MLLLVFFGLGLRKINTSVQLLKLFAGDAKIIRDYSWLEAHLGKLVPIELVVRVDDGATLPATEQLKSAASRDITKELLQLNFLERLEIAGRVQHVVEEEFGETGQQIVGNGMSAATFAPPLPEPGGGLFSSRSTFNTKLEQSREEIIHTDYLRVDQHNQDELWRISLRLGALNDVDYGDFIHELKAAIEPVMAAYRYRSQVLRGIDKHREGGGFANSSVLILGADPKNYSPAPVALPGGDKAHATLADSRADRDASAGDAARQQIDQTKIFVQTLSDLLVNRGFRRGGKYRTRIEWHDPQVTPLDGDLAKSDAWKTYLAGFDCVVLARQHDDYDLAFIQDLAQDNQFLLVDATDHQFNARSQSPITAANRMDSGDPHSDVSVIYTGIVPVVYKAQRTLLNSLTYSIGSAFVMISLVMMVLLRDWQGRLRPGNLLNVSGGMVSMLPNVFPVILIFGAMGHLEILVDIGSMMTASVAMGVAVDDTIHFLNWFRSGIRQGLSRQAAILRAYSRVATAMTQTTAIGGLGLFVFALSTFTPTQRFGVLMLTLLVAALIGDLIMLPALLAGPLGRFLSPRVTGPEQPDSGTAHDVVEPARPQTHRAETPHSHVKPQPEQLSALRKDDEGSR